MSLTLPGWRSRGSRTEQLDLETCKARLEEIGSQLKLGELSEAEADAARLALVSSRRSSRGSGQDRDARGTLIVPVAVFILVAGIGAVTSYTEYAPETTGSGDTISLALSRSGSDDETLARLKDYTRSIGPEEPASPATDGKLLPDVNTMIERLAARLETSPEDITGWRTLGWSYFHMARYDQAATAFARAVELDPSSAELKQSYEEAKTKASESGTLETASSEAMPSRETDAVVRSMVDGLANRLEGTPRDVEGWTRLMRSRVVLNEKKDAATAFRKALEVFKDDPAASDKITAAANELGLKAE